MFNKNLKINCCIRRQKHKISNKSQFFIVYVKKNVILQSMYYYSCCNYYCCPVWLYLEFML